MEPKPKPKAKKTKAALKPVRLLIWTACYRPFIMGGDVNRAISCEVDAIGPFSLGKGIKGYLVSAPGGTFKVVESSSGGIVGDSLAMVKADIKAGDMDLMRQQVSDGRRQRVQATKLSAEKFWELMR